MIIKTVNLEYKMPTVDQALIRLDQAFRDAKSQKTKVLKLIHGYGSTGKGGAIKKAVIVRLETMEKEDKISLFINGENFNPFNEKTRNLIAVHPWLKNDSDYSRDNYGITIVWVA